MENRSGQKTQMKTKMNQGATYKKLLNEFTQKSRLPIPKYETRIEGLHKAPMFRSCVLVNGKSYESQEAFPKRKEAEQDAAKLALEQLTGELRDEVNSIIQDPTLCKMILNEYAFKLKLKKPEYITIPGQEVDGSFISSLVFEGKCYQGGVVLSKKRAEQLAAHAAVLSLLESDSGVLRDIINSKGKNYNGAFQVKDLGCESSNLLVGARPDAAVVPSAKGIDISPSTANMEKVDTVVNSSGGNKRKRETQSY
ncbi:hypothetical protein ACOSP7_025850 [Xanthoceras sorbifolium]